MLTPGKRSGGSKLGAIAGLIITIGFFLPWIRACNVINVSGFDLATDKEHLGIQNSWLSWVTLLAGSACIILYLLANTDTKIKRIKIAAARLSAGILGVLPVINLWYKVHQEGQGVVEFLFGGWITLAGYLGILLSFVVDLANDPPEKNQFDPQEELRKKEANRVLIIGAILFFGFIVLFLLLNNAR